MIRFTWNQQRKERNMYSMKVAVFLLVLDTFLVRDRGTLASSASGALKQPLYVWRNRIWTPGLMGMQPKSAGLYLAWSAFEYFVYTVGV